MRELPIYRDKDIGLSVKQQDLICTQCPIQPDCNRDSLWCMVSFVTKPNKAQKALLRTKASWRHREYQREYYLKNKDKKQNYQEGYYETNKEARLEYQREYRARKRAEGMEVA